MCNWFPTQTKAEKGKSLNLDLYFEIGQMKSLNYAVDVFMKISACQGIKLWIVGDDTSEQIKKLKEQMKGFSNNLKFWGYVS